MAGVDQACQRPPWGPQHSGKAGLAAEGERDPGDEQARSWEAQAAQGASRCSEGLKG